MNRPKTIIHILCGLDGKITGLFMGTEAARTVSGEYGIIRGNYQADAWLYGTVTTKEFTGFRKPEYSKPQAPVPPGDFAAEKMRRCIMYLSTRWERSDGNPERSGNPDGRTLM